MMTAIAWGQESFPVTAPNWADALRRTSRVSRASSPGVSPACRAGPTSAATWTLIGRRIGWNAKARAKARAFFESTLLLDLFQRLDDGACERPCMLLRGHDRDVVGSRYRHEPAVRRGPQPVAPLPFDCRRPFRRRRRILRLGQDDSFGIDHRQGKGSQIAQRAYLFQRVEQ